jgi:hypothetical protein
MFETKAHPEALEQARASRRRATSLRRQASALDSWLAAAYRRRASELEFEAFVTELAEGVPDAELGLPAA